MGVGVDGSILFVAEGMGARFEKYSSSNDSFSGRVNIKIPRHSIPAVLPDENRLGLMISTRWSETLRSKSTWLAQLISGIDVVQIWSHHVQNFEPTKPRAPPGMGVRVKQYLSLNNTLS